LRVKVHFSLNRFYVLNDFFSFDAIGSLNSYFSVIQFC